MPNSPGRIKIPRCEPGSNAYQAFEVVSEVFAVPKVPLAVVSILALFEVKVSTKEKGAHRKVVPFVLLGVSHMARPFELMPRSPHMAAPAKMRRLDIGGLGFDRQLC